jgi:4-diphosphocytidyl-2C-methyl-D-erythritol kinase
VISHQRDELCKLSERLGSDVPFFLCGPLSFAQGRGEKLTPRMAGKSINLLLVKPPFPVSTAWVYEEMRKSGWNTGYSGLTNRTGKVDNIEFFDQVN